MKVQDVMTRDPITIDAEALVGAVLDLMRTRHIRHLPVFDGGGTLVGIVTDRDLRHAALAPALGEYLSAPSHRRLRQLGETLGNLRVKVHVVGPKTPRWRPSESCLPPIDPRAWTRLLHVARGIGSAGMAASWYGAGWPHRGSSAHVKSISDDRKRLNRRVFPAGTRDAVGFVRYRMKRLHKQEERS